MLNAIRRLIADVAGQPQSPGDGEDDIQLAAAALLFHVIAVDGTVTGEERETLVRVLSRRFGLDETAAKGLVVRGEQADAEAIDLYSFTSVLKERLDQAQRERIVEMMWRMVFADGVVHEFEDNAVWRIAELLAVPTQTRVRLKQSVRDDAG